MATLDKAVNSTPNVIKFDAAAVSLRQTDGKGRATLAARIQQGKAVVSNGLAFLNRLGFQYATSLVEGQGLDVAGTLLSTKNAKSLACLICGQIHGDVERPSNEGQWNASRLALSPLFIYQGKAVVISEACVADYILPNATADKVKNLDGLRASFSRFLSDRAKRAKRS